MKTIADRRYAATIASQSPPFALAAAFLAAILIFMLLLYYQLTHAPGAKTAVRKNGYSVLFSIYGHEGDRLYRPEEVTADKDGRLYVVDSFKHRIVVFDRNGAYAEEFGEKGAGYGKLEFPSAIAVADDGRAFVLSYSQNKIVVFDQKRKPVWEIKVLEPEAATIKKNRLYVATARGVMIGDLKGNLLTSFGTPGKKPGQFDRPTGIAVDGDGNIYVSDSLNYRLQALSKDGEFKWAVGSPIPQGQAFARGAIERKFSLPVGLTIDDKGYLYLMDAFSGEIYIFDRRGKEIARRGEWGSDEGQFYYPSGIAYLGNETFAVADKFNDRVQILRIPSPVARTSGVGNRYYLPLAALIVLALALLSTISRRRFKRGS